MLDHSPLARKLGIKPKMEVWCVEAPKNFHKNISPLPTAANTIHVNPLAPPHHSFGLCILFSKSQQELIGAFTSLFPFMGSHSTLWICWPKKASGLDSDLSFDIVQKVGLAHGLVDNKVCSIDDTWSSIRHSVRVENRPNWNYADYL